MKNRKIWKQLTALVVSATFLIPGPVIQAEEGQAAEEKQEITVYGESRGADENGFVIDESGVLKRYFGTATEVEVPFGVTKIDGRAFYGCKNITSIKLLHSVTEIGYDAFRGCSGLEKILLPDSLQRIDSLAFRECSSLTSIDIPEGVTYIAGNIFEGCSNLAAINVSEGNGSYTSEDGCLYNKDKTKFLICPAAKTEVNLPDSVTIIESSAFRECSRLQGIELPESVTQIWSDAFKGCSSLVKINIPAGMTYEYLSGRTFRGCSSLVEIEVAEENSGYTSENGCLYDKGKTRMIAYPGAKGIVTIPDTIEVLADGVFEDNSNLTEIVISDNVTEIGGTAFWGCSNLTKIEVSEGNSIYASEDGCLYDKDKTEIITCPGGKTEVTVSPYATKIGHYAFEQCGSLAKINIPDSVETIGFNAFSDCISLTEIYIPGSVTDIAEGAVFAGCSSLRKIEVSEENGSYSSDEEGCLYNKNKTVIYACPGSKTEMTIPESVHTIKTCAFACCRNLIRLVIPESVKVAEIEAFADCDNLTIYGKSGSYAQTCAEEWKLPFVATDGTIQPEKKNLSDCQITISPESCTYDGTAKTPSVTVRDGGNTLEVNVDYNLAYANNINIGTGQVILTGTGKYTGTVTRNFRITGVQSGTGGTDTGNSQPGTSDTGNSSTNTDNTDTKTPQPDTAENNAQNDGPNLTCTKISYKKVYGDKSFSLGIKLKDTKGTLTCTSSNKKVATVDNKGKVTIKGTGIAVMTVKASAVGNYSAESVKITVEVSPKKQTVKSLKTGSGKKLKVSWKKDNQATGYQIQYSTDKKFKKSTKTVNISKYKTTSKTISKLKAGKKYYVRIRAYKSAKVNGKSRKLYGAWSSGKRSGSIKK